MVFIFCIIIYSLVKSNEFYESCKGGGGQRFSTSMVTLIVDNVFSFLVFDLGVLLFVVCNYNICFAPCCNFCLNMHLWSSKGVRNSFYFLIFSNYCVATPLLEECEDDTHTPKMGTWESFETSETPRIGVFFISLESYESVDVENELA